MRKMRTILYLSMVSIWISSHTTPPAPTSPETPKITSLFSHGIAATKKQAFKYAQIMNLGIYNDRHIINNQQHILISFNYPDAGESYHINRRETSLAQANEVKALDDAHLKLGNDAGVVGIGVSRGASAFVVWMGTHPDEYRVQNVRALILESPFDSIDSVLRHMFGGFYTKHPTVQNMAHGLVKFIFSKYDKNFTTPFDAAATVPRDLPILIVCSEQDTRVPAALTKKLYDELVRTGHTNVHFVKLKRGAHGKLIEGADCLIYRNAVHAFYQKYNLPYHTDYAELGKALLAASQPVVE